MKTLAELETDFPEDFKNPVISEDEYKANREICRVKAEKENVPSRIQQEHDDNEEEEDEE